MKKRPIKDLAASIRQRLRNNAQQTARPFQEVLQYFAIERFLYRLTQSPHADKFILKGALMLTAWRAPASRPTKDIDLLAQMDNTVDAVLPVIRDICNQETEPDGLVFDSDSLRGVVIREDADYEGVRVLFPAQLENARVQMQIDLGFGDVVFPAATLTDYPTILDLPAPKIRGYSRETVVAEKFQAMVMLGQFNTRLKDFFDILLLSRHFDFDGPALANAVAETFANRKTPISPQPIAFTMNFAEDPAKNAQWRGFLQRSRLENMPPELSKVVAALAVFLTPVAEAVQATQAFDQFWPAAGPWRTR
jgi:hypothetical protein